MTELHVDSQSLEGGSTPIPPTARIMIVEKGDLLGHIHPCDGGIRIVSTSLEKRMGVAWFEAEDPPALRINLRRPPPKELHHLDRLDLEFDSIVEGAVRGVYNAIFGSAKMTGTEQRLAWALVVEKLLNSMVIEAQSQMLRERFESELKTKE